jgi:hypothetical protein
MPPRDPNDDDDGEDDDAEPDDEPDDEPAVIRDSDEDLMDNKLAANPPNTGFAEGPL